MVDIVAKGFYEVMEEGRSLDQVSSHWIKQNPDWNSFTKGFFAESLMEVVRWWRLLETSVNITLGAKSKDSYRLMVLTCFLVKAKDERVNEFFQPSLRDDILKYNQQIKDNRAIAESIPDWLDSLAACELGDSWSNEIKALNSLPPIILRANTLKTTRSDLFKRLAGEGFQVGNLDYPDALILNKRADIFKSKTFFEGLFEVQDASSQGVAPFLQVEPGMRVVDACAGNGGKTLHIASLMKNKGKILALDNADWKLEELMKRATRAGVSIIEPRPITTTKVVKRLKDKADRLLLDVPCSGLGVLRRNPDSKWRLNPEKIQEIKVLQAYILDKYSQMVKSGGKMVYSTCSILPSENQQQVKSFLSRAGGSFVLEEEKSISPALSGFDGFYMARMMKVK
ncbi:MAG: RsmB/NOP family class I SAM-dependent RNA methyltransferase [Bacteroidales bacterium]|nr:RsmB/NOP family class I SAM-dependent RNA methyltransferase [Bacteroidales bacterium]